MSKNHYDVVIIGSGAGGTLALKLAPSGRPVLFLSGTTVSFANTGN